MFYTISEGDELRFGINIKKSRYSIFNIILFLPFWLRGTVKTHKEFCTGDLVRSRTIFTLKIGIRLRNRRLLKDSQPFVFRFGLDEWLHKPKIIYTEEQAADLELGKPKAIQLYHKQICWS